MAHTGTCIAIGRALGADRQFPDHVAAAARTKHAGGIATLIVPTDVAAVCEVSAGEHVPLARRPAVGRAPQSSVTMAYGEETLEDAMA